MAMNSFQWQSVTNDRLRHEDYGTGDLIVRKQSRLILLLKLLQRENVEVECWARVFEGSKVLAEGPLACDWIDSALWTSDCI